MRMIYTFFGLIDRCLCIDDLGLESASENEDEADNEEEPDDEIESDKEVQEDNLDPMELQTLSTLR